MYHHSRYSNHNPCIYLFTDINIYTHTYIHTYTILIIIVAGHSSYWTLAALEDLSDFIMNIYLNAQYQELIALKKEKLVKRRGGDRIVDMHLLYLWWVAHHNISDVGYL